MLKRQTLVIIAGIFSLLVLSVAAWATAGFLSRESDARLSEGQLNDLGVSHWTAIEQWTFGKMRKNEGAEIAFADFEGDGPRSISARFLNDAMRLGTNLDGTGFRGLNFNGAVVQGDLALDGQRLDLLRLVGTTIGGKLSLSNVQVVRDRAATDGAAEVPWGDIILWDVTVAGIADFANVQAHNIAVTGLEGAGFVLLTGAKADSIMISESYGFDLVAILRARVGGEFVMRDVELATDLVMQGLSASSMAFENMTIGGQFDGAGMVVDGDVLLAGIYVGQELILTSSAFGGDLIAENGVSARGALTDATVGGVKRVAIQRHTD